MKSFRSNKDNPAPCFINEGTIYHKIDMLRALETFENLRYKYFVAGQPIATGEGMLLKVFASRGSATLVINNCIFINVLSFDYLNFKSGDDGRTQVELVEGDRSLILESLDEEISRPPRPNKDIMASVDQFDDEETFALLDEADSDDDD